MAKLSNFKINSKAFESGEWVKPGEEFDDLEIFTRGFNDQYHDAKAAKMRRSAMRYGGDQAKIPNAESRAIFVECIIGYVLLDVRGLSNDEGEKIDFAGFCELLRDPDFAPLFDAAAKAACQVGLIKKTAGDDDLGN